MAEEIYYLVRVSGACMTQCPYIYLNKVGANECTKCKHYIHDSDRMHDDNRYSILCSFKDTMTQRPPPLPYPDVASIADLFDPHKE